MESKTVAIWLKVGDRFRFEGKETTYYVTGVQPKQGNKLKVSITGSRAKCFSMTIDTKIIKVKAS